MLVFVFLGLFWLSTNSAASAAVAFGLSLSSAELTAADVGSVLFEVRGVAQKVADRSGGLMEGGLERRGEFGMTLSFMITGRDHGELKLRCLREVISPRSALVSNSSPAAPLTLMSILYLSSSGLGRLCDSKSRG